MSTFPVYATNVNDLIVASLFGKSEEPHCPYDKILFREFLHYIVAIAYAIYSSEHEYVYFDISYRHIT